MGSAPDSVHENVICITFGVEVRNGAIFCYNCGSAVARDSRGEQSFEVPDTDADADEEVETISADDAEIEKALAATEKPADKKPGTGLAKRRPLTAAMLRRKKAYNRKPVEIVWEEPESDSPVFLIVSLTLALIAFLILLTVFYIK